MKFRDEERPKCAADVLVLAEEMQPRLRLQLADQLGGLRSLCERRTKLTYGFLSKAEIRVFKRIVDHDYLPDICRVAELVTALKGTLNLTAYPMADTDGDSIFAEFDGETKDMKEKLSKWMARIMDSSPASYRLPELASIEYLTYIGMRRGMWDQDLRTLLKLTYAAGYELDVQICFACTPVGSLPIVRRARKCAEEERHA